METLKNACSHEFTLGKALMNIATNGQTTDSTQWERGEGVHRSSRVRTVTVYKCVRCGVSEF